MTEVTLPDIQETILAIRIGKYDGLLGAITTAVLARRKELGVDRFGQLKVGDRVMLVGVGTGAKYLNGLTGTINKKLQVKLEVRMDPGQDTGRFGSLIRIPPNLLQPLD
jgi:hypothetical protein